MWRREMPIHRGNEIPGPEPRLRMVNMKTSLRKIVTFISDEAGAASSEYVLLATLIAVAILVGATTFGTGLSAMYSRSASQVEALAK